MNTIKTLVVVTTLLAVGYGAHIVLNKPIPNGQFDAQSGLADHNGFVRPELSIDGAGPMVTLPSSEDLNSTSEGSLAGLPSQSPASIGNRFARPQPLPEETQGFQSRSTNLVQQPTGSPSTINGQPPSAAPVMSQMMANATQHADEALQQLSNQTNSGMSALGQNPTNGFTQLTQGAQTQLSSLQNQTQQLATTAANAVTNGLQQVSTAVNQGFGPTEATIQNAARGVQNLPGDIAQAAAQLQSSAGDAIQRIPNAVNAMAGNQLSSYTTPGSSPTFERTNADRFNEVWLMAQSKLRQGQLVDALFSLSMFYNDNALTDASRDQLIPLLDQLAGSVIYSRSVHVEAPYTVQTGDTLQTIAAEHRLTPAFVGRTNALASPIVQAGQQLKVLQGPFRGELSLSRRELTLFVGRYYAGRFPVAIGRDLPPQASMLEVTEILGPQPYTDPRTGEQIAAGDANNPYGNQWIALQDAAAPAGTMLGMHSTGAMVEASDSRGCISLSEKDAADLQAILVPGSRIQIVP